MRGFYWQPTQSADSRMLGLSLPQAPPSLTLWPRGGTTLYNSRQCAEYSQKAIGPGRLWALSLLWNPIYLPLPVFPTYPNHTTFRSLPSPALTPDLTWIFYLPPSVLLPCCSLYSYFPSHLSWSCKSIECSSNTLYCSLGHRAFEGKW